MSGHTLVITNDYPPRKGGIQTFIYELVSRFPADQVTVLTSDFQGSADFDARHNWKVVRRPVSYLLPTRATRKVALELIRQHDVTNVVFGAAAPLGLLAQSLRNAGVQRIVSMTHGHEAGWASTPITRSALRRIAQHSDYLTYLGDYTKGKIASALRTDDLGKLQRLAPGVDTQRFNQSVVPNASLRHELGLQDRPVIVCVSRLMPRKGQDVLIAALPHIHKHSANTALVLVGKGRYESALRRKVAELNLSDSVIFAGSVDFEALAQWYAVGDVFAMPCRTRRAGWDVEGLGIVYLEASAMQLPVVAGQSGGAPDAVLDGQTGLVVNGSDVRAVARTITHLLMNPNEARQMGINGRSWVEQAWTWDYEFSRLQNLLLP